MSLKNTYDFIEKINNINITPGSGADPEIFQGGGRIKQKL